VGRRDFGVAFFPLETLGKEEIPSNHEERFTDKTVKGTVAQ
jgi:hypothetical protein